MAETNFTLGPTSKINKFPLLIVIIRPELANIKNGGQFFSPKKDQTGGGGGAGGGFGKRPDFFRIFFSATFP